MTAKDAIDVALRQLDLASRVLQFFTLISVALGGLIISSDVVGETERLAAARWAWSALIVFVGGVTWYAILEMAGRVNAALDLAEDLADEKLRARPAYNALCRRFVPRVTRTGLPVLVAFVVLLILCF